MVGQLTTAYGAAVYLSRHRYMMSSGAARIPFSTGGKLYYFEEGASAGVEITKPGAVSFSMTSSAVRWQVIGRWLYVLDSADTTGSVWRVNLSAGTVAEEVRGLTDPSIVPSPSLRDSAPIISSLGTATWAGSATSSTQFITSGQEDFPNPSAFWAYRGGATAGNNLDSDGVSAPCVELDQDAGTRDYVNFAATKTLGTTGYKNLLKVKARYAATDEVATTDDGQSLGVRIFGCDSSDNRIVTLSEESEPAYANPTRVFEGVFDLRPYPEVTKFDIELSAPRAVDAHGTDVRQISVLQDFPLFAISNASGVAVINQGSLTAWRGTLYSAGVAATVNTTSTNLSAYDSVTANIKKGASVSSALSMRLGFKVGSAWFYSLPSQVLDDTDDTAFDISLIASSLTAVVQIAFEVIDDLSITGLTTSTTEEVFRVGEVRVGGALSLGVPISYVWTQIKATGSTYDSVSYESGGSEFSSFITPTSTKRRSLVSLATPTLDAGTTHIGIYRLGGATPDGDTRARLVAMVSATADTTSPGATTQDSPTNKYFWDVSEWAFYDNVPDEDLIDAPVYQLSRDMVPTGATAIAHYGGRLWLARYDATRRVNDIYGSWLIDSSNDWPYMSEATDPEDPELAVKGLLLPLGGQGTGDRAVAFATSNLDTSGGNVGGSLMVLRQSEPPAIITGSGGNFRINPSPQGKGGGCYSAQGVENVNGATVYVASVGLVSSQGYNLGYLSERLERRLTLEALGKARLSSIFLVWHSRRLWAIIPGAGSTDGEALVWDERAGDWTRISGYLGLGFTSACSLSGGEDSGDLYLGGRDGQIYKMAGSVATPAATTDKTTPSGTARAIAWSIVSRRHGQAEAGTSIRVAYNRPTALYVDVHSGAASTLSWSITNEQSQSSAGSLALPSGRILRSDIREIADVRGMTHSVSLSGSSTAGLTLHSYLLKIQDLGETN
jgi:hypothetical protein